MEADVLWVMLAPIHPNRTVSLRCWWKISIVTIVQTGKLFHQLLLVVEKNSFCKIVTDRAPFGLFYHAAWFTQPHHKEGFIKFLDTINAMNDVWLVTNWQALQWVRDPTPIERINQFQPFQCDYSVSDLFTSLSFKTTKHLRDNLEYYPYVYDPVLIEDLFLTSTTFEIFKLYLTSNHQKSSYWLIAKFGESKTCNHFFQWKTFRLHINWFEHKANILRNSTP